MTRTMTAALTGLALVAASARADDKGQEITIDGLKSKAPAAWKVEEPTNRMRSHQIRIPKAEGDKEDAELLIFYFGPGGGGGVDENLKRWKGMFVTKDDKKIDDDDAKVEKMKVGSVAVTYLDVAGTYLFKAAPFDPNAKTEKKPNYRMLGVVFESEKGPYFMRLVGPAKTVEANKKAFDGWLKNFK